MTRKNILIFFIYSYAILDQININKVEYPNQLHYLNAPKKLKEQFLHAVQQYRKGNKRLSSAVRFEISMMLVPSGPYI